VAGEAFSDQRGDVAEMFNELLPRLPHGVFDDAKNTLDDVFIGAEDPSEGGQEAPALIKEVVHDCWAC
jgi:hypothetical protein